MTAVDAGARPRPVLPLAPGHGREDLLVRVPVADLTDEYVGLRVLLVDVGPDGEPVVVVGGLSDLEHQPSSWCANPTCRAHRIEEECTAVWVGGHRLLIDESTVVLVADVSAV